MYLTYDEYMQMGGNIDAALFPRFEAKARKRIDALTFGRLIDESPVRESVRMCMFELIQAMYEDEALAGASGRDVSAASNDGVSVTYDASRSAPARYGAIVRGWLLGETDAHGCNLMYAGVNA